MVRAVFFVLGMLGVAVAQYTGPVFDPSNAPFFGPSGLVDPTLSTAAPTSVVTPTSRMSSASGSLVTSVTSSGSILPTLSGTGSRNATMSSTRLSSSTSHSSSSSSSSVSRSSSASSSASASAPAQSTGAAVENGPGVVGAIAGGVLAGLAML